MSLQMTLVICAGALILAAPAPAFKPQRDEMKAARDWSSANLAGCFSFVYDGKPSSGLLPSWNIARSSRKLDAARTQRTISYTDPKTGLTVRCVAVEYSDFPTVEWTVYVKNTGAADTPIISDLQALDATILDVSGGGFLLHHNVGSPCQPNDYEPLVTALAPGVEKRISAARGRPTSSDLSYFNIKYAGGGVICAVGWPGQWAATFTRDQANGLHIRAGQELTHFTLHPGEEVRTPLIALQFWKGDWVGSQNVWRRWMLAHNVPRAGGKAVTTHYASCYGNLLPHADEEMAMIDGHVREKIKLDYWILDAGWYTNNGSWVNVGTWEPDKERFPRGLREVADRAHAAGMKFVVWFEPERVRPGTWLYEHHPEWLLSAAKSDTRLLDLGNPEARKWVTDHVDKTLKDQGIDVLRQDFNIDPLDYWRSNDAPDRQGITENRYVAGFLAYWDELLRRDPNRWIDTCASGGRRNDLETLRRSVPLLRSDYTEHAVAQQCHTYGISLWIPVYGSGTGNSDLYLIRSSICPMWRIGWDMRKKELDYDLMRREVAHFRRIEPYLIGDYYPLTPYSQEENVWMAWQFDRPDLGAGMVQAFRRSGCDRGDIRLKLSGLDAKATYEVTDLDTAKPFKMTGAELLGAGLPASILAAPGAVIIVYRKAAMPG